MRNIAATYYIRVAICVGLLIRMWREQDWSLALLLTLMFISIEIGHSRVRDMYRFIMLRARTPPITGGPHAGAKNSG